VHLLVNVLLLFWIGRIVESWVGIAYAAAIYVSSVLSSAAVILLFHNLHPMLARQSAHQAAFLVC
jgi:membrane associated rhomboid family serine protease